jgi:Tfp pilus assembly protein PilN
MIIRNNLASSPLHNYSLYLIGCLILAAVTVAFTIFNINNLADWFSESGRLQARISEQKKRLSDLQTQGKQLQQRIDRIKTPQFVKQTDFFNTAIKKRTFSWTRLFDQLEQALPDNVRMISIFPSISGDDISISMEVAGRSLNDMVEWVRVLENSSIYSDVVFRSERHDEDGLLHSQISLRYWPDPARRAAALRKTKVKQ